MSDMPKFLRFTLLMVFLRLAATLSLAQSPPPLQVRFLAQSVPDGMEQIVMVANKLSGDPFALPTQNLSDRQTPPARGFALKSVIDDHLLGSVTLPDQGKDFIVLLVVGGKPGYTPIVIDSTTPGFQVGQVYTYNASNQTILGQVGSSRFEIPSGTSLIIKPEGAVENRYYNVAFGLRNEADNHVRLISTSRWPVTKVKRSYLFFFGQPQKNTVTFRAVDEYLDNH